MCKNDNQIRDFLNSVQFNLHLLTERIELSNVKENIGRIPVRISDEVHSQFQLNLDEYRD